MKVVEYDTEYSQNAFGNKSGNRARKRGVYECTTCGEKTTVWADYARLPVCLKCQEKVEWAPLD